MSYELYHILRTLCMGVLMVCLLVGARKMGPRYPRVGFWLSIAASVAGLIGLTHVYSL